MHREDLIMRFSAHHAEWAATARYHRAVQSIREGILGPESKDHAVVLEDVRGWRTALLGLAPNTEIPLHDHPHTRGILFVVEGTVTIRHYDIFDRPSAENVALLTGRGDQEVSSGDHVPFGCRLRNLHAISSHRSPALLFSVRQRLTDRLKPSLYAVIPQAPTGPNGSVLAMVFPSTGSLSVD